jgi:predicted nucleotidyltransferase component of viral defense system
VGPNSHYTEQVRLLVPVLSCLAARPEFALKGGTAINLFFRELPRLSVDIDLVYLPLQDRDASMAGIDQGLRALAQEVERTVPGATTQAEVQTSFGVTLKLTVRRGNYTIKVEVTPVLRGNVLPVQMRELAPMVQAEYGRARVALLAFEEVYAGKLCAALSRQHPRDLYDVRFLLRNEGITETLKNVFLVYLMAADRPLAELLDPSPKEIRRLYETEFVGMTREVVTVEELEETRRELIVKLHQVITVKRQQAVAKLETILVNGPRRF